MKPRSTPMAGCCTSSDPILLTLREKVSAQPTDEGRPLTRPLPRPVSPQRGETKLDYVNSSSPSHRRRGYSRVWMGHFFAPERHDAGEFVLRSYEEGDGAALLAANLESYEHLKAWMPWATPDQTVDDAEILVRRFRAKYLLNEDFVVGAFSPDGRRLLAGTGFHLREGPLASGCAEIGMFVRASEAGRGLGTRILTAMLRWGFTEWPWQRLSWRCDNRNQPSLRIAQKCGLRLEGTARGQAAEVGAGRRDTACYALTRPDWQQQHS